MREIIISKNEANQRFDKYLKKLLSEAGSSFIYKMLRKKNIVLNGKKADGSEIIVVGDSVKLFLSDETFEKFSSSQVTKQKNDSLPTWNDLNPVFDIIYEDEDVLIINKPAGMLSQKAEMSDVSCNEYIISYLLHKGAISETELKTFRPSVLNRLDRNTSGILIAGKTLKGSQEMSKALSDRTVHKYYYTVVSGKVISEQNIKAYLTHDEKTNKVSIHGNEVSGSKRIETRYIPIRGNDRYTLLEIELITGRTHQIRAHLSSIGHPIAGDGKYGNKKINDELKKKYGIRHQLLHAHKLVLTDGNTVTCPMPELFNKLIQD